MVECKPHTWVSIHMWLMSISDKILSHGGEEEEQVKQNTAYSDHLWHSG